MKEIMKVITTVMHIFIVGTFVSGKDLALSIEEENKNDLV